MTDSDVTLTPEQNAVLAFVGDKTAGGDQQRLSSSEIATALEYDEIGVIRAIEALAGFGLVRVAPDEANARKPAKVLGLTDSGAQLTGRAHDRQGRGPQSTGGGGAW